MPVVPGTNDALESAEQAKAFAAEAGYPVILKARSGGGGRGMRVVYSGAGRRGRRGWWLAPAAAAIARGSGCRLLLLPRVAAAGACCRCCCVPACRGLPACAACCRRRLACSRHQHSHARLLSVGFPSPTPRAPEDEMEDNFARASAEALAAFGDGGMFVEKYLEDPRHIEIQVD